MAVVACGNPLGVPCTVPCRRSPQPSRAQAEYRREGIEWVEVLWKDNRSTLELIEGRPGGVPGVLAALDDATWRTTEDDADATFLHQLHASFARSHEAYIQPKLGALSSFGIVHYAGDVRYDVRGFSRVLRRPNPQGSPDFSHCRWRDPFCSCSS